MVLFVTFSALLNMGIGYALGAKLSLSDLLQLLPTRKKKSADDLDGDDALTRPPVTKEPQAKAEEPELATKESEENEQPTKESAEDSNVGRDTVEEATAEVVATEEAPPATSSTKPLDVMAGLVDFREQLASAGLALKLNQDDPDKFTDCAQTVQKANHGYIEKAIETATSLADQGDAASVAASEIIATGVEKATAISEKFDEHLEGDLTDEKKAELVNHATAMKDAAAETQLQAEEQLTTEASAVEETAEETQVSEEVSADEKPVDEPTNDKPSEEEPTAEAIPSIAPEKLFEQIEKALELAEDEKALLVASLSADPIEGHEDDGELLAAIAQNLDELIGQVLAGTPSTDGTLAYSSAAADPAGRPLMLLAGDTLGTASKRIESLRQMVEATTFQRGEETFQATVTCAITECRKQDNRTTIEAQLTQAIDESERHGHNKTYHHDGAFPTPLPELSVETSKRTVQI